MGKGALPRAPLCHQTQVRLWVRETECAGHRRGPQRWGQTAPPLSVRFPTICGKCSASSPPPPWAGAWGCLGVSIWHEEARAPPQPCQHGVQVGGTSEPILCPSTLPGQRGAASILTHPSSLSASSARGACRAGRALCLAHLCSLPRPGRPLSTG